MTQQRTDAQALKVAKVLKSANNWKTHATLTDEGYYNLQTEDTGDVPVRLFLTPSLLAEVEDILYRQIVNATRFPGVKLVVITPDTHYGYGVPVGCVLLTDVESGAVAMGPVGYDIGCFTGDTLIPLIDGRSYRIKELAARDRELLVYALSPEHKVVVAKATARKTRTDASLVGVTLDNGREIRCTPDHEFMLRDGGYAQAQELRPGTSLMRFDKFADKAQYKSRRVSDVLSPGGGDILLAHGVSCGSVAPPMKGPGGATESVAPPGLDQVHTVSPTAYAAGYQSSALYKGCMAQQNLETSNSMSKISSNHKVVEVERLNETADVYCLTVPEYGNFALDAGVFVHNCGMMSASSEVPVERATPEKRLQFNKAVMRRVEMGAGGKSHRLGKVEEREFNELVRGGAEYYVEKYGATFDRSRAERHRIPVDDNWQIPWGGKGRPERGLNQLGSLGGGNHFIELQRSEQTGTMFVQVHTGSRGFGHGMATNYFEMARTEKPDQITDIDLGYFTPDSVHYRDYLNAVAAGGNFAILNRLIIFEQIAEAFREVFREDLELIYEISHNLVQREQHPEFGEVWVHRKGATRAFPAGHPALQGTIWEASGHPVLIPGSNKDWSYILRPLAGAVKAGFSVNHGAGRRLSRGEALRRLSQRAIDDEYRAAGILVNDDGRVPLDEAAPCYKSSEEVVAAVVGAGLAEVEHRLWPLASLKGTEQRGRRKKKFKKAKADKSEDEYKSEEEY